MKKIVLLCSLALFSCQKKSDSANQGFRDFNPCTAEEEFNPILGICFDPNLNTGPIEKTAEELCLEDGEQWLAGTQECVAAPKVCEGNCTEVISESDNTETIESDLAVVPGKVFMVKGVNVHISKANDLDNKTYLTSHTVSTNGLSFRAKMELDSFDIIESIATEASIYTLISQTIDNERQYRMVKETEGQFVLLSVRLFLRTSLQKLALSDGDVAIFSFDHAKNLSDFSVTKIKTGDDSLEIMGSLQISLDGTPISFTLNKAELIIAGEFQVDGKQAVPGILKANLATKSFSLATVELEKRVKVKTALFDENNTVIFLGENFTTDTLKRDLFMLKSRFDGEKLWYRSLGSFRRDEVLAAKQTATGLLVTGFTQGSFVLDYNYGSPTVYCLSMSAKTGEIFQIFQTVNDFWEIPTDVFEFSDHSFGVVLGSVNRDLPREEWRESLAIYRYNN